MAALVFGLILFLGAHSLKMAAPRWRKGMVDRRGEGPFKGIVALSPMLGIVLIIWGFASSGAVTVYAPPRWGSTVAAILMVPALILAIASVAPAGHIKNAVVNPLLLATILWAAGHLLSNGDLAGVLLFGAFLAWSIIDWAVRPAGGPVPVPSPRSELIAIAGA
jgi:uncharacterized membrane protein